MAPEMIPLSEVERKIRDGDEKTLERARSHCAANTQTAVGSYQKTTDKLEATVFGAGADRGLVRTVDDNTRRIATMENTIPRSIDNLTEEIRSITSTGRTPRNGTHLGAPDSTPPARKSPVIDRETLKMILIVMAAGGIPSAAAVADRIFPAPAAAVQVQAQAVADKQAELERRELELRAREARVPRMQAEPIATRPSE